MGQGGIGKTNGPGESDAATSSRSISTFLVDGGLLFNAAAFLIFLSAVTEFTCDGIFGNREKICFAAGKF